MSKVKIKLALPETEPDDDESGGVESTEEEVSPGIHGTTLAKAIESGDGEAIEEAVRAIMSV